MSLSARITIDPDVVHGRPVVRGTRMRVAEVLSLLEAGASERELLEDYPYLTQDDIRACLEYGVRCRLWPVYEPGNGTGARPGGRERSRR